MTAVLPLLAAAIVLAGCATDPRVTEIAEEYYNLGNLYFELEEYERSYELYLKAQELDPTIRAANYNLARLELERGNPQVALELLEELRREEEGNLLILETIAYTENRLGNLRRSQALYREVLAEDPGRVSSLYNLSLITDDQQESIELLREASDLAPGDEDILRTLVARLTEEESPEAAAVYLERLRRIVTEDRGALEEVARQYESLGYPQEAVETYDLLIELDPADEGYYFAQARLLLTTIGDERNGIIALENALEQGYADPEAIEALLTSQELVAPARVEALLAEYGQLPEIEEEQEEEEGEA